MLIFHEIYPESIADFNIIEKFDVICCVEWEYKSMLNKGFTIENFYSIKGVYLNRPSQKKNAKSSEAEAVATFDTATTGIHVERLIGHASDWSIRNKVYSIQKTD